MDPAKRTPNLVPPIWYVFVHQILWAIIATAPFIVAAQILLQTMKSDRASDSHMTASLQRHLDAEQDPAKLRKTAMGLWDMTLSGKDTDIMLLRLMRKMSICFAFAFAASSVPLAIFAYRLQRQNRRDAASDPPPSTGF